MQAAVVPKESYVWRVWRVSTLTLFRLGRTLCLLVDGGVNGMKKAFWTMLGMWMLIMAAISPTLTSPVLADERKPARPAPSLGVGDVAPDFKLQYFDGKELKHVSLSDYRGKKNVVLAFYVFAFTGG